MVGDMPRSPAVSLDVVPEHYGRMTESLILGKTSLRANSRYPHPLLEGVVGSSLVRFGSDAGDTLPVT